MQDVNLKPLSVTELNQRVKDLIDNEILLKDILIWGEIGTLTKASSGHWYITLKDGNSEIKCNIWRSYAQYIKVPIKTGDKIVVSGSLEVYVKGGSYQFIGKKIIPLGLGTLQAQFEALKKKLSAEGLFNQENKIPIPKFPQKIALVTSPTGAVIRDMVRVARRRMPSVNLLLIPALVQGDTAAKSIAGALRVADSLENVDLVILARGGGSMEDLWCFNEELVVRQIASMKKPIISAVGHETDTTLSDYAADLRAGTPSIAMELAVQDSEKILEYLRKVDLNIYNSVINLYNNKKKYFETLSNNPYLKEPDRFIKDREQTIDRLSIEMNNLYSNIIIDKKHKFANLATQLDMLSPLKILSQGYSVTEKDGNVLQSVKDVKKGDTIKTYLQDGEINSVVD